MCPASGDSPSIAQAFSRRIGHVGHSAIGHLSNLCFAQGIGQTASPGQRTPTVGCMEHRAARHCTGNRNRRQVSTITARKAGSIEQ
jgi:hypothetical protein